MYEAQSPSVSYSQNVSASALRDKSPCAVAYDELAASQHYQAELLHQLIDRLGPVLRDMNVAKIGGSGSAGVAPPQEATYSEIHGQLIAAKDRTLSITVGLNNLLDRLTI